MVDTEEAENELTIGAAAQRQFEEHLREEPHDRPDNDQDTAANALSFDTDIGDPQPPSIGASREELAQYQQDVDKYANEVLECMTTSGLKDEDLWIEFTCSFKALTIRGMSPRCQIKWAQFLRNNGVHVKAQRGFARWKALQECLNAQKYIPWDKASLPNPTSRSTDQLPVSSDRLQHPQGANVLSTTPVVGSSEEHTGRIRAQIGDNHNSQALLSSCPPSLDDSSRDHARTDDKNHRDLVRNNGDIPNPLRHRPANDKSALSKRDSAYDHSSSDGYIRKGRIDGLMKAYTSRAKFSGSFNEDFDGALEQYETLSSLCELSEADMARAFPVMLTGAAFSLYTRQFSRKSLTFAELADAFRGWYTSDEQRYRLLQIWQSPSLSREMQKHPEKSEVEVFGILSDELTKVQHQLHTDYRHDRFLRDQLLVAADIPHVRRSLVDKIPPTAQEAMQRIAALLSSEPKSAGAHLAQDDVDEVHYGMGKTFGGHARKSLRPPYIKKRKSRNPLASVKGCWVCGKDHRARGRHPRSEILKALKRIKAENPSALYTAEHISDMYAALADTLNEETSDETSDDGFDDEQVDDDVNFLKDIDNSESPAFEAAMSAEVYLANASYVHGRNFATDLKKEMLVMHAALSHGESSGFDGIIIDTGANRSSVMSHAQYKAYCNEFNVPAIIDRTDTRGLKGIGGQGQCIGTAIVQIPFNDLDLILDVKFRILQDTCPSLLSLRDMRQNGLDLSIQQHLLYFKHKCQDLLLENDFLKYKWNKADVDYALYTDVELRRLHRVFGHPSVSALQKLLKRANPEEFGPDVTAVLHEINKACKTCAEHASKPRRFKITIGSDDLQFNHVVAIDVMYIGGKPVLHVVDEATHYSAAVFLKRMTAEETWKCLLRCWIRTYLGPPDHLRVDQGSNFVAKQFLSSAEAEGISVLEAPIESPNSMSHVERYHAPLRAAYEKIRDSLPKSETDADCLQMAIKSVNDTIGPEGLCPTLLVYGAIPRPPRRTPAETQIQRARAIDAAIAAIQKEHAKRKIAFAFKHPSSPKAKEQQSDLQKLPAGAPVLVYRDKSKKWEGPFPFISIDDCTVVVQLPSGRKLFRSTVVKPAPTVRVENCWNVMDGDEAQDCTNFSSAYCVEKDAAMFSASEQRSAKPNSEHSFVASRKAELQGLRQRGTFDIVERESIPNGMRIYGTRWVDIIKIVDGKEIEKSRLVAQNYRDMGATSISTKSPTISRMGQRIAVATASLFPNHVAYTRDISQAYVQSESNLERPVYLEPPKEMQLSPDKLLLARKPLYGIPESGLHWYITYHNHHKNRLDMSPCRSDPCLLYGHGADGNVNSVVALQVDDVFGHGDRVFLAHEEQQSTKFECKPRKLLGVGDKTFFNGCRISLSENRKFSLDQGMKLSKLKVPTNPADLVSARALIQYIASCTRPDLCAEAQLLSSSISSLDEEAYKRMEKLVRWCRDTSQIGLNYVKLDKNSLKLLLFTDASFANANKLKSQLGFVVVLADKYGRGNIIHYGSTTCKRVARSVMAAELHALVYGFDNAYAVRDAINSTLGLEVDIHSFVDSRTVFNVVAKHANTAEKRLQIDVNALRQSYHSGEMQYFGWIPGEQNIADGLTKGLVNHRHPLWKLMTQNTVSVTPKGWSCGM